VCACQLGTSFVCDSCSARSRAPAPFHLSLTNLASLPHPFPFPLSCSFRIHTSLLSLFTVHARSHRIPPPFCDASLAKAFVDALHTISLVSGFGPRYFQFVVQMPGCCSQRKPFEVNNKSAQDICGYDTPARNHNDTVSYEDWSGPAIPSTPSHGPRPEV
jgi:hypothetical protein